MNEFENCETCKYWLKDNGTCHKNPPTTLAIPWDNTDYPETWAIWPPLRAEEWCGEWKSRESV